MNRQTTMRNVPADDLPEVLDMLLEHLGLRLMVELTPDYTAYELAPKNGVTPSHGGQYSGKYKAEPGRQCAACITPRVCERDSICFYPTSPDAGVKVLGLDTETQNTPMDSGEPGSKGKD